MTFRYFLRIHLLFCALLFSCNVYSSPVLSPSTGSSIPPGSQFDWSDTDIGSDYWVYVGTSPGARDWPAEFFVRLWYRPIGMAWAFVDTKFISENCPAPVKEQYDNIKERVDNGVLVLKDQEPFDGTSCSALYGPDGSDDFNYRITVFADGESGSGDPFHPEVAPAFVSAQGLVLWMTKGEARACANYIECTN